MIWKIMLLVLGLLIFAVCLYNFLKKKEDKKARRLYGIAAYFSLGLILIGLLLLGEYIFSKVNIMWLLIGILIVFYFASRVLIAPCFKVDEDETEGKNKEKKQK